jgi:LysM repeat protein
MDDDATRRGPRDDDPEMTGPMWPLPDDGLPDEDDDLTRPRAGRPDDSRSDASRRAAAAESFGRAPDEESTTVLSPAGSAGGHGIDPTRVAPDGARDWLDVPLPEEPARARAGRPRPRRAGPAWPRIVAPIALLAAVLAVVTLSVHSGVLGGAKTGAGHPTVTASQTSRAGFVYYRVRKGDSMSTIAGKYHITLGELLALNPKASVSTIAVGQRLKVPNTR